MSDKIDYSKLEEYSEAPSWFVRIGDQNYGPYTRNQIRTRNKETEVKRPGIKIPKPIDAQ